ncbi:MAG: gas vesicle protein GvpFL, partial [Gammaproteobacteria bacterium]|nr:gas vesicle protein GvpFL [Gammaproteobacteria bacterium]
TEKEIMHLACLVDRDAAGRFEQAVLQAARPFDNNYAFDFNGPWAPHNFVEMDIQV